MDFRLRGNVWSGFLNKVLFDPFDLFCERTVIRPD